MCEESVEQTHDENERQAMYAIMNAAASRGKGKKGKIPTVKELYDRNAQGKGKKDDVEDALEQQKRAEEWLANFDLSKFEKKEG